MPVTNLQLERFIFIPSVDPLTIGVGIFALDSISTGTKNTALGNSAGTNVTTGSNNLLIGSAVASTLTTGSNNIVIGTSTAADVGSASTSNTFWLGAGATAIMSATSTNGTPVVTIPGSLIVTGSITQNGGSLQAPVLAGATLVLTSTNSGQTILMNVAAGSVVTLPAATGSGVKFKFVVTTTTTSGAHKILAASSSDFFNGNAVGHTAAGATLTFSAAAATVHSIQMPFTGSQPSGGFIGDYFAFQDVAANLWAVDGMYQAGTVATTPFSSATT